MAEKPIIDVDNIADEILTNIYRYLGDEFFVTLNDKKHRAYEVIRGTLKKKLEYIGDDFDKQLAAIGPGLFTKSQIVYLKKVKLLTELFGEQTVVTILPAIDDLFVSPEMEERLAMLKQKPDPSSQLEY
jgi:hypothetical protein